MVYMIRSVFKVDLFIFYCKSSIHARISLFFKMFFLYTSIFSIALASY
jgi:hypothetical protein